MLNTSDINVEDVLEVVDFSIVKVTSVPDYDRVTVSEWSGCLDGWVDHGRVVYAEDLIKLGE